LARALVAAGLLAASGGCAAGGKAPSTGGSDPGMMHVHGLGVDPADGALYAATHTGLFRIPSGGAATRVGGGHQDTMGFTVVGSRTFLASGHPGQGDRMPAQLGLVESTDAGRTWTGLSLGGQADFHALHAAHGEVYGYDSQSGAFLVSSDRRQWEARSVLAMYDFAVSPQSADVLLATTDHGLARSTDGGRTWRNVAAAPRLVVLCWEQPQALYGVQPDGTVQRSADGGATWTVLGRVGGQPEAIAVDAGTGTVYVAAAQRGILASTDGGRTFAVRSAG
jgi:DNA-binding beta-propeller fold protein YncE